MKTRWADIRGFNGVYQVSDFGGVRRAQDTWVRIGKNKRLIPKKTLKPRINEYGYAVVKLSREGSRRVVGVHILVLEAFVGPCPEGMQCRHLDGNPINNHVDNLTWGTAKENSEDRIKHGTQVRGERQHSAKLRDSDIPEIHRYYQSGETCEQIAARYRITGQAVKLILAGKTYRHCQPAERAKVRPSGFQSGNRLKAKLSEEDRVCITAAHAAGTSYSSLAKQYRVSYCTIWNFLNGKSYR